MLFVNKCSHCLHFYVKKFLFLVIIVYLCNMNVLTTIRKALGVVKIFVLTALFCCAFTDVHAQVVTVSNNLLYDAFLTPNLRVGDVWRPTGL